MLALDARFVVRSVRGTRVLPAGDFFLNAMTTALAADEILVEIRVPPLPRRTGWAFHEVSRRQGDFALVGAAALLTLGAADVIERARLAFTGAGPRPTRARHAEDLLVGAKPDADIVATAARAAAAQLTPESDLHASADYRREVGGVLAGRALTEAAARAREAR
jgi:carbon-monoxide dehydrogenase medium subunit